MSITRVIKMGGHQTNKTILIVMIISLVMAMIFFVLYLGELSFSASETDYSNQGDLDYIELVTEYDRLVRDSNQLHSNWQNAYNTLSNCYENSLETCNTVVPTWG